MLLLTLLCGLMAKVIPVTIIYEKVMPEYARKTNEFLIKKIVDEYNSILQKSDVSISLTNLYDYQTYSVMKEYKKFSSFVGEPELDQRDRSLSKIHTNIIVIYSSVNGSSTDYNNYDLCKSRFYYSYGRSMSSDSIIVIISALKAWIENILQIKLNEVFELKHSYNNIQIKQDILDDLDQCSRAKPKKKVRKPLTQAPKTISEDSSVESMFSVPEIIPADIDKTEIKTKFEIKKTDTLKGPKKSEYSSSISSNSSKAKDTSKEKFDPFSTLKSSTSSSNDKKEVEFEGRVKKFIFPKPKNDKDEDL